MKRFDIEGALVIIPSFVSPFSVFAVQPFSDRTLVAVIIASIMAGCTAWKGYLSVPRGSTPANTEV